MPFFNFSVGGKGDEEELAAKHPRLYSLLWGKLEFMRGNMCHIASLSLSPHTVLLQ